MPRKQRKSPSKSPNKSRRSRSKKSQEAPFQSKVISDFYQFYKTDAEKDRVAGDSGHKHVSIHSERNLMTRFDAKAPVKDCLFDRIVREPATAQRPLSPILKTRSLFFPQSSTSKFLGQNL